MKKSGIIALALAGLMITFTSCQDDSPELNSDLDALELESDAATETTYDQVDEAVQSGFDYLDANEMRADATSTLPDCATVTHDQENKTVTIDFGDGCEGALGNVWAGKIVVEYNLRAYEPGAYRIITFVDLYFNDIKVEGTRTITNTSVDESVMEFTVTLVGGKLDFGDDIFITRDAEWVRKWYIGEGIVTWYGEAEGTNINGIDYSTEVDASDPITLDRFCFGLPVSGTKTLTVGDRVATLDYGDGECDRLVEVTINGNTFTRNIRPRAGRR